MKNTLKIAAIFLVVLLSACSKDSGEADPGDETSEEVIKPKITSDTIVTNISGTSATIGGNLAQEDGYRILNKGVCYSTTPHPTINDQTKFSTETAGPFICNLTGLHLNTTYYARTFATYTVGETGYGAEVTFTTNNQISFGNMTYELLSRYSVMVKNSVPYDGGVPITQRGVCYDTLPNPTYPACLSTSDGAGSGMYTSTINNLKPSKIYYFRPYIVNSMGVYYGNALSIKSLPELILGPTIQDYDGNVYHTIILGNQTWMLENLKTTHYNNGDPIPTTPGSNDVTPTEVEPKYQWIHKNNLDNLPIYGRLYTWYAATDGRGIAPAGWRVPSWNDWSTLVTYLMNNGFGLAGSTQGNSIGKSICSQYYWLDSDTDFSPGKNRSNNNFAGLSLVPGGKYNWTYGFIMMNGYGCYMSTTPLDDTSYNTFMVQWDKVFSRGYQVLKNEGISVRCVKNN